MTGILHKAHRIDLFSLGTRPMRAFHTTWLSFFLCFFSWFGIAPLMAVVRDELHLTKEQVGNTIIASVSITILARLFIGWLCDRIGPRLAYTGLLIFGSLPVMGIGLAQSYEAFLLFRLAIGAIGGSFVITQYHTSVMFAPNCVGTANATSAGWGNLGGGVTQIIMPLVFAGFVSLGFQDAQAWRLSMVGAGLVCLLMGVVYFFSTTDFPDGNLKDLRAAGVLPAREKSGGTFMLAARDRRVWALFVVYAACFGIELTINNIAALYFKDYFGLGLGTAGLVAGLFGLMNIFARTTGGVIGDKFGERWGLSGRVRWLFYAILVEGAALLLFSRMDALPVAIGTMVVFSLFVQMAEGATYSVVPFINPRALGSVAGIVGAGGNVGAVAAGFVFRSDGVSWPDALFILGFCVVGAAFAARLVTFSAHDEAAAETETRAAIAARRAVARPASRMPWRRLPQVVSLLQPMDVLRVFLGAALCIKGIYFLVATNTVSSLLDGAVPPVELTAWYVVAAHTVGGAAMALGLATRLAVLANLPVLAGALWFVHVPRGLFSPDQGLEFSFLVFVLLSLLLWHGGGKLSMDHWMRSEA